MYNYRVDSVAVSRSRDFHRWRPSERRLTSVCLGDGTCVIEISHKEGTVGDIAGEDEIRRAALNIADSCVFNPMHKGGLVRNLGRCLLGKLCLYTTYRR